MVLSTGLYLLKSCAYILAFYIPFVLVLKPTTFFTLNRIYLLSGLLLSFVLPLYTGITTISAYTPPDLHFMEPFVAQTQSVISQVSTSSDPMSHVTLLAIIYVAGITILLIRLTFSIAGTLQLKRTGEVLHDRGLRIVRTNTAVPFSFFHFIFLPKTLNDPGVLNHEAAHVRQYHWVDLLIVEVVSIVFWFNPIMIFYRRSLCAQHEYLADRSALAGEMGLEKYLETIKQQLERLVTTPLISEFSFESIKNRINMITKKRTSAYGLPLYTLVVPFILCLLMAFSPRKHFPIADLSEADPIQDELSMCLPIDKKDKFSLESGYGERMHPILKVVQLHTGIDLSAKAGVPVVATEEGTVIKAELLEAWGNIIIVQHNDTYTTSYSHLQSMHVKAGDKVQKGQTIGLVGNTGMSTKDHLHFELQKNGVAVDPISYLPPLSR